MGEGSLVHITGLANGHGQARCIFQATSAQASPRHVRIRTAASSRLSPNCAGDARQLLLDENRSSILFPSVASRRPRRRQPNETAGQTHRWRGEQNFEKLYCSLECVRLQYRKSAHAAAHPARLRRIRRSGHHLPEGCWDHPQLHDQLLEKHGRDTSTTVDPDRRHHRCTRQFRH